MIHAISIVSADKAIAMAHVPTAVHVAVIGHRTLSFVLALMSCGCLSVRSLRPDAVAPDCEAADLVWIVDVTNDEELASALRAARQRAGNRGRVVVEGAIRRRCRVLLQQAAVAGFDVVSFDHRSHRIMLAAKCRQAVAA